MKKGIRHLIRCRCTLPQYKQVKDGPRHQFPVFSVINENDQVEIKFSQCNNCGIVHKVTEINKSEIMLNKENLSSVLTIDDIKQMLPDKLIAILESHDVDVTSWELASFILEQKQWGNFVVLSTDTVDGIRQGKYVIILSESMFKIEQFTSEEQ